MKAYRLDLRSYPVVTGKRIKFDAEGAPVLEGGRPVLEDETAAYDVRESIANVLMSPERRLIGSDLLRADELARRVLFCKDDAVTLAEEEFAQVRAAVEAHKGYGRSDVEFVRRVLHAPSVEGEIAERR